MDWILGVFFIEKSIKKVIEKWNALETPSGDGFKRFCVVFGVGGPRRLMEKSQRESKNTVVNKEGETR